MNCVTCQAEILEKQRFGARFADGKWSAYCEKDAGIEGLPLKVMNPALLWVVNGQAAAHRAAQKAQELAEANK